MTLQRFLLIGLEVAAFAVFMFLCGYLSCLRAAPPVRLIPADEEAELRRMLPVTDNAEVNRLLSRDDLVFYTHREMPPAYQLQSTFHSPRVNVSNPNEQTLAGVNIGRDPHGNPNREFPWAVAAGTDDCENVETFLFFQLPPNGNKPWPVVTFTGPNEGESLHARGVTAVLGEGGGAASRQRWMFPVGTTFGEFLTMHHDGQLWPFELRLRMREAKLWEVDVYRPCPTASSMADKIRDLRPGYVFDSKLSALLARLEQPEEFKAERVTSLLTGRFNRNARPLLGNQIFYDKIAFETVAAESKLPLIDEALAGELLTRGRWQSASGKPWKVGTNGVEVHAPTTDADGLSIVPQHYKAHLFAVDSGSCFRCHSHTGDSARLFDANRGWYGRVRGNDGIFTWHPIALDAISYEGSNRFNKPVKFRLEFMKAGIVEAFDQSKHPADRYVALPEFPTR